MSHLCGILFSSTLIITKHLLQEAQIIQLLSARCLATCLYDHPDQDEQEKNLPMLHDVAEIVGLLPT